MFLRYNFFFPWAKTSDESAVGICPHCGSQYENIMAREMVLLRCHVPMERHSSSILATLPSHGRPFPEEIMNPRLTFAHWACSSDSGPRSTRCCLASWADLQTHPVVRNGITRFWRVVCLALVGEVQKCGLDGLGLASGISVMRDGISGEFTSRPRSLWEMKVVYRDNLHDTPIHTSRSGRLHCRNVSAGTPEICKNPITPGRAIIGSRKFRIGLTHDAREGNFEKSPDRMRITVLSASGRICLLTLRVTGAGAACAEGTISLVANGSSMSSPRRRRAPNRSVRGWFSISFITLNDYTEHTADVVVDWPEENTACGGLSV